jgi:hypothetical protein
MIIFQRHSSCKAINPTSKKQEIFLSCSEGFLPFLPKPPLFLLNLKKEEMYGTVGQEEVKGLLSSGGNQLYGYSKQKLIEFKKYADEGNWSWKVCGALSGLMIMVYSILSVLYHLTSLSPVRAVIDVYLFFIGMIAVLLEYKENFITKRWRDHLHREALFLYRPYGRALFYIFAGVLMLAFGGLVGWIMGAFVTIIGVFIFGASRDALSRLEHLKLSIHDDQEIAAKFKEFDQDNDGFLGTVELAALCKALGTNLTIHELESAILVLDANGDGKISFSEFHDWWKGNEDLI